MTRYLDPELDARSILARALRLCPSAARPHIEEIGRRVYSVEDGEQRGAEFELRILGSLTDVALGEVVLEHHPPELAPKNLDFYFPSCDLAMEAKSLQVEMIATAQLSLDMSPEEVHRMLNMAGATYSPDIAAKAADAVLACATHDAEEKHLERSRGRVLLLINDQQADVARAPIRGEPLQELTDRLHVRGRDFRKSFGRVAIALAALDGHGGGRLFLPQGAAAWETGTVAVRPLFRPSLDVAVREPKVAP